MRIVTTMGYVYKLSERSYRKLLRLIATDQEWRLEELGTRLADDYDNVTDMTAEEARDKLDDLKPASKRAGRSHAHLASCQLVGDRWFCAADCPQHVIVDADKEQP